jgi:hypothetical protein
VQIQNDGRNKLMRDPIITTTDIGFMVTDGQVTLQGSGPRRMYRAPPHAI